MNIVVPLSDNKAQFRIQFLKRHYDSFSQDMLPGVKSYIADGDCIKLFHSRNCVFIRYSRSPVNLTSPKASDRWQKRILQRYSGRVWDAMFECIKSTL